MKYFLSFALTLMIIGCSINEFSDEIPNKPDAVEIDINEDGIIDFVIVFRDVLIETIAQNHGGAGISGRIEPSNNNQILYKKEERNLFLREIEEIKESVNEPLLWSTTGFGKEIMSIHNNTDGQWQRKWEVNSNSVYSTYFMGLKVISDNLTQVGWVEIDINTNNGKVEVIDKGIL